MRQDGNQLYSPLYVYVPLCKSLNPCSTQIELIGADVVVVGADVVVGVDVVVGADVVGADVVVNWGQLASKDRLFSPPM